MLAEVLAALQPRDGERFIDGTFGAGGYTRAILETARTSVLAIDRDPAAIAVGVRPGQDFGDRLMLVEGRFGALDSIAREAGFAPVDGVVLDIGVSSMQIDAAERGFSFMTDGPLDMRMGRDGPTAAELVNELPEAEIANALWRYGEERRSRAIAKAIAARRKERPFERTGDLAALIERVLGRGKDGRHPATRSFQALRILVNDELDELSAALEAAERVLAPGGRLAVVTFHSLEDRIVKVFLRERTGTTPAASRHAPAPDVAARDSAFRFVNRHAVAPTEAEIAANPRARSGKLRWAVRS
jgi:16S rRNA (cytosine1402-N4)-methyltransferase